MILQIVLAVSLIILFAYYFVYLEPKKKIKQFADIAQAQGYKVKLMPFQFMQYFLVKYLRQDNKSLRICKEQFTQYDIIVGNIFASLAIVPVEKELLKDFFNQSAKLPKNPLIVSAFELLNGGGVFFSQGEQWKKKRRTISSVFHFDFLNEMIPLIKKQIDTELKQVDRKVENKQKIDLLKCFMKILSSVITKSFFGTDLNEYKIQGVPYCEYFLSFLNDIMSFSYSMEHLIFGMRIYHLGLSSQSRELRKKYNLLNSIAKEVTEKQIEKMKNNEKMEKNMLTALYESGLLNLDFNSSKPEQYTMYDLIGEFLSFFAAGTDTTANTVNLALHYLSQNPEIYEKVQKQIDELQKNDRLPDPQKLKAMKWTDAVFNQSLRLNGPVGSLFIRRSSQDLQLGRLQVPKGSTITVVPPIIHHKKENFQNPHNFDPERWMSGNKVEPFLYIPFGAGERNCIGQYLARIEAKLLLDKILTKYEVKAVHPITMKAAFVYSTIYGDFELKLRNQAK